MHLFGIVVVDKPEGLTSFDVVARARKRFHTRSIGHTGTLDPMATGVLPLCVAESTRIAQFLTADAKEYEADLKLGEATDTQDRLGRLIGQKPVPPLTPEDVERALAHFRGPQLQTPPMYSALSIGGERLYEKARRGETVERQAREITIHALDLIGMTAPDRISIRVRCSKGTYIRTLASDIGEALGTLAHLTALRRTRSGDFTLGQAVSLSDLMSMDDEFLSARMIGERQALSQMAEFTAGAEAETFLRNGRKLPAGALPGFEHLPAGQFVKIISAEDGALVAIAECHGGLIRIVRGLPRVVPLSP